MRWPWRSTNHGIVPERRRHVPHLHPALGPPAHELDLLGVEVRAAHRPRSCRRTPRRASLTIEAALDEVARHRRARDTASGAGCTASRRTRARTPGWPRSTRACRPGCRRSGRRRRTCRGGAGRRSRRASRCRRGRPRSRRLFFARALQERQVLVEHVLDAEEHVAEPGPPHQRRQRRRRAAAIDDVIPCTM